MAFCDKPTFCAICEHQVSLGLFSYTTKQRSPFASLEMNMDELGFTEWLKSAGISTYLTEWAKKDLV
jgi:hypothetical protein